LSETANNRKQANRTNLRVLPEPNDGRWNDPESLEALAEANDILANPDKYKWYRNVDELIADCLEGDDDDD